MSEPVTLITGASRGIGRAVADRLIADGHRVINISRTAPAAPFGGTHMSVDLGDRDATARALDEIVAAHDVDNLINNAALIHPAPIGAVDLDRHQQVQDLNVRAVIQCVQACLPAMRRKRHGRIVNVSSRAVLGSPRGRTSYVASKGALTAMGRSWALELAKDGITVNTVAPGPIETQLLIAANDAEERARMARDVPMNRLGRPEEVASAIRYFLDKDAGFITGQTLYVCGGLSAGLAPF
ncbi:MAG: SDR family oxidoreductase [Alphaproteobacteria bacterium]